MKLIIGLGNPGKEYSKTRHNMGFRVVDALSDALNIDIDKEVFGGMLGREKIDGEDILLFKPMTFMNLSGTAVIQVVNFYKISVDDICVVFDDMALAPGLIRMRVGGSSGGQKGMKNIIEQLGTENIKRIRVGIGESKYDVVDYVLGKPTKAEEPLIEKAIENAKLALIETLKTNFEKAMSKYNPSTKEKS